MSHKTTKNPANAQVVNALWGGRFAAGPAEIMERINASIGFDRRLHAQDIRGSRAHLDMLEAAGIVSAPDAATIRGGLDRVEQEIAAGRFVFKPQLEDIHMNIEARLAELVGPVAGRLHTGAVAQRPGGDRFPAVGARRN